MTMIGSLTEKEMEAILETLPVDITFVDAEDKVKAYNKHGQRIFARQPSVIGRAVQKCHPEKSLSAVNRIIDDFKAGTRHSTEFWINLEDKFVYIRYFPVKDKEGKYLGVLEVTQDVSEIRKLEGEKRLLDEK
jgi:PAS domain S-box-containing protein